MEAFDVSWSVLKNDIPAVTTNEIPREYYDEVVTSLQSRIKMLEDQLWVAQQRLNSPFYQKPTKEQILSQYDQQQEHEEF